MQHNRNGSLKSSVLSSRRPCHVYTNNIKQCHLSHQLLVIEAQAVSEVCIPTLCLHSSSPNKTELKHCGNCRDYIDSKEIWTQLQRKRFMALLFCDVMWHRLVVSCQHCGAAYWSQLLGWTAWYLKKEPTRCLELLVTNYQPTLCNILEHRPPTTLRQKHEISDRHVFRQMK